MWVAAALFVEGGGIVVQEGGWTATERAKGADMERKRTATERAKGGDMERKRTLARKGWMQGALDASAMSAICRGVYLLAKQLSVKSPG
jgi:hypothetical protein